MQPPRWGDRRIWWVPLFGAIVWQGWMTLTLFGGPQPWKVLLDERPIVSGRHPLHLYHGYLGARCANTAACPATIRASMLAIPRRRFLLVPKLRLGTLSAKLRFASLPALYLRFASVDFA